MSTSPAKLEAARSNGAKSHGATTRAGRARSAQNAIKHGLCSVFITLTSEDQEQYNRLLQRFMDAQKPADAIEEELVARMARATWQSERAVRLQSGCFVHKAQTPEQKLEDEQTMSLKLNELNNLMRYQTMHERAYDRAAAALAKHRKEKFEQERRFVSQKRQEAAEARCEKREKQGDERFEMHQSREKIKREIDRIRLLKEFPPDMQPQVAQMVG